MGVSRLLPVALDRARRRRADRCDRPAPPGDPAGWKKFEPMWDVIIRAKRAGAMLPVLETILGEFGRRAPESCAVQRLQGTRCAGTASLAE